MNLGDTFRWCPSGAIPHLYIIITDPALHNGDFILVNITGLQGQPTAWDFVLNPGDHGYIYKQSRVSFEDAEKTNLEKMKEAVDNGFAIPKDPMDLTIVARIAKAATTHPAFQRGYRKLLPLDNPKPAA